MTFSESNFVNNLLALAFDGLGKQACSVFKVNLAIRQDNTHKENNCTISRPQHENKNSVTVWPELVGMVSFSTVTFV